MWHKTTQVVSKEMEGLQGEGENEPE
jgi:hypothetical protein